MTILIKGGRVLDPASKTDQEMDLFISDGKIQKAAEKIETQADQIIDAQGCYVMPGLIDMHVHLRDPGLTYKETIESGARAAAKGGFTTIVAMPNTKPVMDDGLRIKYVVNKAKMEVPIHVLQAGAITKGQLGKELADIEGMVKAGAPAISEDGKSVMDAGLCRRAMQIAARLHIPVLAHCEDKNLAAGGVFHEDANTARFHLPGITSAAEDVIAARDILLAKETGVHLHLCHCSTKDSVRMVKEAKEDGICVSAEVCPHHFSLCTQDIPGPDANYKMNPPLRAREDMEALRRGLQEDIIDVIATDHAPHSASEKMQPLDKAPFGIVGLETAVALTVTNLVEPGILTPMQMAEKMSYRPAQILGLDRGSLEEGKDADIVIIDPEKEYQIDKNQFASKGKNTPFHGMKVKGMVMMTICGGEIVYQMGENPGFLR